MGCPLSVPLFLVHCMVGWSFVSIEDVFTELETSRQVWWIAACYDVRDLDWLIVQCWMDVVRTIRSVEYESQGKGVPGCCLRDSLDTFGRLVMKDFPEAKLQFIGFLISELRASASTQ